MTEQAVSPLRRRMIEDMTIRKFAQKTQHDYVQRVKDFAIYLKRSPNTATPEDVRGLQLHLSRGFVPWRFPDAARRACGNVCDGRRLEPSRKNGLGQEERDHASTKNLRGELQG